MRELPSGTVTFLFTDIAGSTQRWEHDAEAMRAILARHDALLGAAIENQGGVVFKTVGDAFYAAFTNAPAALDAALAAQRALFAEQWGAGDPLRVRMALHTGSVEAQNGDYFGRPLNRVARLLSAGHGGQTLVSGATEELLRDSLSPGLALRDMGEARLKDLLRPEHIYQVVAPDLPADFPPLKTLDARRTNLPAQANMLVGREREAMEVVALLRRDDVRLVTLTGPGGTGKTRLGVQAAAECLDFFPDGVLFVALADVVEPARVLSQIAETLGVTEGGGQPLVARLHAALRAQRLLLVLDNFEQVKDAAPALGQLLAAAPGLKALATSRSALHIYGEREYPVPPLPLPDRRRATVEQLMQYESVRLFVARAQEVKADFALTPANVRAVADICARLDGLPLAIELAAARIKVLTPQLLLGRLAHALQVLTGGARDLPARQQTLRGAIDWSYTTLGADEQTLFARMAVFAGGGTLTAIEAICDPPRDLGVEIIDGLSSLADKSLLRHVEEREGEPRFAMLGTIREYALERLEARGELAAMRHAHTMYYLALAEEAEPHLTGAAQSVWLAHLEEEHDNLHVSIRNALEADEYEMAARLVAAFWRFWFVRGYLTEGRRWMERALAHPEGVPPLLRAKALDGLGALMRAQGEHAAAQQRYEESLTIRRGLGHQAGIAHSLSNLAGLARDGGDFATALRCYEECLAIRRATGDSEAVTRTLINLGILAQRQGDYDTARARYDESLAIGRKEGYRQAVAHALMNLGVVAQQQGDDVTARARYEESLADGRAAGDTATVGFALNNLGAVAKQQGDFVAARAFYAQSLVLRRELGDMRAIAFSLTNLGMIAQQQGDDATARAHFDEALAIRRELGDPRALPFSLNNVALAARQQGDGATARAAYRESLATSQQLEDTRGVIEAVEGLAALAATERDAASAAKLWGAVETLRVEHNFARAPEDQARYERDRDAARNSSPPNVWKVAWAKGAALPLSRAIEIATMPADAPKAPAMPKRPAPPGVPDRPDTD
ncbi:MAG: tetratricopeptide repeat protein [Chloroflexota bacterium]|nr:tetratricopeptide repeat protein [Chloroflexota bacterium]